MSFQEKTRWAGLVANLLIWGWYFANALGAWRAGNLTGQNSFGGVILAVIGSVIVQVAVIAVAAAGRPDEADVPLDERDRDIARKGAATAYSLLCFGVVMVIGAAYFTVDYLVAINLLMLVFIAVECIRYGIEIAAYRRGYA